MFAMLASIGVVARDRMGNRWEKPWKILKIVDQ